jgi:hypothetical protein
VVDGIDGAEPRRAPSPRWRGEGRGEEPFATARHWRVGRQSPLTRKTRDGRLPTSPSKRGEVIDFCGNDGGRGDEGAQDQGTASFETAALRPPQDEGLC